MQVNMSAVLTEGQALLATYPDTYKLNVYKSRRSYVSGLCVQGCKEKRSCW